MTLVALALVLGHVGSPDVFYEGHAGPYALFVSIRTPPVVPGVATIEIRSSSSELKDVSVVPMRLTGPGSKLPPTPDHAERSAVDPKFFTANLWIMERGAMQVRITADGPNGSGVLAVPVPSVATRVLPMTKELGVLLFGLMLLLGAAAISIAAGGAREALLEPGAQPDPKDRRRGLIAGAVSLAVVGAVIAGGRVWWNANADEYQANVYTTPQVEARVEGGRLELRHKLLDQELLPDHGHPMHLFVVRESFDEVFHLHPERSDSGAFAVTLPTVRGGRYRVFADIVTKGGFPITFTATAELPAAEGPALTGDDSGWNDTMQSDLKWTEPQRPLRSGVASAFRFEASSELEPYMGMAGHAVFIRKDFGVFAHVHPVGSVAMPALQMANDSLGGPSPHVGHMDGPLPPRVSFPYGLPSPGDYRVFVQVKRNGQIETGVFDAHAD